MGQTVRVLLFSIGLIIFWSSSLLSAAVIYVDDDAPPGGDGMSWSTAYNDLQDALDVAMPLDEIWIGQGTYLPSERLNVGDPRSAVFQLKSDLLLIGGFAGYGQSNPYAWDIHSYPAILSGDHNGDDGPFFSNRSDNSYHVIYNSNNLLTFTTILAGIRIRGGNADGLGVHKYGGGIYCYKSSPMFLNSTIYDNEAEGGGGAWCEEASPYFINCVFHGNRATSSSFEGGGMHCRYATATVTNCTFSVNEGVLQGGGVAAVGPPDPMFTNCILWDDQAGSEIVGNVDITYSDIEGGYPGIGNINADPLFVDAGSHDYHLTQASPCIDVGNNNAPLMQSYDYDAEIRIVDGDENGSPIVDMGADEFLVPAAEVWVDDDWIGHNYGDIVEGYYFGYEAFAYIQDGLDGVKAGGTVNVAEGTYTGERDRNLNFWGKAATLISESGPYNCIIDCEKSEGDRAFRFFSNETPSSRIEGFTIRNGYVPLGNGAGIVCTNGSPTITRCVFENNYAEQGGAIFFGNAPSPVVTSCTFTSNSGSDSAGAIWCSVNAAPLITKCTFTENVSASGGAIRCFSTAMIVANSTFNENAAYYGGGILTTPGSGPKIVQCEFTDNFASAFGGGLLVGSEVTFELTRCDFEGNTAAQGGGIFCNYAAEPEIIECNFKSNTATESGGGIYCDTLASPAMSNCTFALNSAAVYGGGVACVDGSRATLLNCSLAFNSAAAGGGMATADGKPDVINSIIYGNSAPGLLVTPPQGITVSYSDIQGGWPGTGNIDSDPRFVAAASGDLHLCADSPCGNAGYNMVPGLPDTDFEGDPRITYGTVDMGADEFHPHLYFTGNMTPAGAIQAKLVGLPGTSPVGLFIGSGVRPNPLPTIYGDFYLLPPRILIPLIPIPADGVLVIPTNLPPTPPAPYDLPMQALIGLYPNSLTNLYVLEVR